MPKEALISGGYDECDRCEEMRGTWMCEVALDDYQWLCWACIEELQDGDGDTDS